MIGATTLIAFAAASCDKNDRAAPAPPTAPPAISVVRLELVVPRSIAPGESVQRSVRAVKSDNSVETVTSQSQWNSSSPHVVEISADGVAKGL